MARRTKLAATGKAQTGPSQSKEIEEQILTLNATAPELVAILPQVFRNAVLDSVNGRVESRESRALLAALRDVDLGSRMTVFAALDSFFGRRARGVEAAIDQRFHSEVRGLVGRVAAFQPILVA